VNDELAPKPWHRGDNETSKAYAAFIVYRDLGIGRSLAKVGNELGKSRALLEGWCAANSWVIRADAWDREQDRLHDIEITKQRKAMAARHARMATAFQSKVVDRLATIKPAELTPAEALRWFQVASDIERRSLGEPDRKYELTGPNGQPITEGLGDLTPEQRRARLEQIQAEAARRLGAAAVAAENLKQEWAPEEEEDDLD
jgi:hypothetical protein